MKKIKISLRSIAFFLAVIVLVVCGIVWRLETTTPNKVEEKPNNIRLVTFVDRGLSEDLRVNLESKLASLLEEVQQKETAGTTDVVHTYLQIGNAYYSLGQLDKSLEFYQKILAKNPNDPPALENSGQTLYEMGDYVGAEKSWRAALTLNPWEITYIKLADLISEKFPERQAEIQTVLEEAITNLGQTPGLLLRLGDWYLVNEKYSEAISHYEVAQTLNPDNEGIAEKIIEVREKWTASQNK